MALQLAYRRMHGRYTAVYETASTRLFLHGRTDTIRSFTSESRKFCEAMLAGSRFVCPLAMSYPTGSER
jgi:carnitine O-acetyltransferase